MPLSTSDIRRIVLLGFSEDFFVITKDGERRLKNLKGRCVFHDGQLCTIYRNRPEGCRTYPVVLDLAAQEPVLDPECPHREEFHITPSVSRKIVKLVRKMDRERIVRVQSQTS
jgi:Fe-S-cluster containining protein